MTRRAGHTRAACDKMCRPDKGCSWDEIDQRDVYCAMSIINWMESENVRCLPSWNRRHDAAPLALADSAAPPLRRKPGADRLRRGYPDSHEKKGMEL